MPDAAASTAVILANGIPPSRDLLRRALHECSLFVCADGGANAAREYGLVPAAIVGDIDSATQQTLAHFHEVPQVRDSDQERTDLEKAIDYVLGRGSFGEVTILGGTSGRLDHVLGHISVLRRYHDRATLVLEDDHLRARLVREDARLECAAGTVVSFFAVGGPVSGVITENLRYPLRGCVLQLGVRDSVSNVVEAPPAWIRFESGELLVLEVHRP